MNATAALPVVGIDVANAVFQLAVADSDWKVVEQHRLTRSQFERWFANRAVGSSAPALSWPPDSFITSKRLPEPCQETDRSS